MTDTPIARDDYRAALIRWIADLKPDLYVTFVFNTAMTLRTAQDRLEAFQARVDRKLLGPKWQDKSDNRTRYIAFAEKVDSNIHIHAVFQVPTGESREFAAAAPAFWKALAPAGNLDIQDVTHAEGVADYITKEIRPERCDQMFLPRQRCVAPVAA